MKKIRLILALFSIAGWAFGEATNAFEIISYFPDTGKVWTDSGAGKTNRAFDSFTTAEQQQITDWLTDREFGASGLDVAIEKKETTRKTDLGEIKDVSYSIELKNRSRAIFENVEIGYKIFFESQDGAKASMNSRSGRYFADIKPGEVRAFETQKAPIRNEKMITPPKTSITIPVPTPSGGHTTDEVLIGGKPTIYVTDRLRGLYLCISKRNSTGQLIKREYEEGSLPSEERRVQY